MQAGGTQLDVAVLVPCYNEEATIASVVQGFRQALPDASVYVYDNNSRDATAEVAREAGAIVRKEPLQGKGNVIRRMFADVDADVYVLVDGDATYDASSAGSMVQLLLSDRLDMVTGVRLNSEAGAYRSGHRLGNVMLTRTVGLLFGRRCSDLLSGYRTFSRRFVKSFPVMSSGFEIETEFTVHALELGMPIAEIGTPYRLRPMGSTSKLNTYRDGLRILKLIIVLYENERPLLFFLAIAAVLTFAALAFGIPVIWTFLETGLVPRLPTAVLATGLALLASFSAATGLILDTVTRGRREMKRLAYLACSATRTSKLVSVPASAGMVPEC